MLGKGLNTLFSGLINAFLSDLPLSVYAVFFPLKAKGI
jgi:hypothetical protein